MINKRWSIRSK